MKNMILPIIQAENRRIAGLRLLYILLAGHLVAILYFLFDAYVRVI